MRNPYYQIALAVIVLFLIAGNLAWLNPRPGFIPAYTFSTKIPFYWQYYGDSRLFLETAATFPDSYRKANMLFERPVLPMAAHVVGALLYYSTQWLIEGPSDQHMQLIYRAALGYFTIKLIVFFIFGVLYYKLLNEYMGAKESMLAVLLALFAQFAIIGMNRYHTYEYEFISPLFLTYMLLNISRSYTATKNVLYSFLAGVLLLTKTNFATYLAVIIFCLFKRRFKESVISVGCFLLPVIAWLAYAKIMAFPVSGGVSYYGYGLSIFKSLSGSNIFNLLKTVQQSISEFWIAIVNLHTFWLVLASAGFYHVFITRKLHNELLFIALLVNCVFVQFFLIDNMRRTILDLSFIIFGLAAYVAMRIIERFTQRENLAIVVVVSCWIIWDLVQTLSLPWVNPLNTVIY